MFFSVYNEDNFHLLRVLILVRSSILSTNGVDSRITELQIDEHVLYNNNNETVEEKDSMALCEDNFSR